MSINQFVETLPTGEYKLKDLVEQSGEKYHTVRNFMEKNHKKLGRGLYLVENNQAVQIQQSKSQQPQPQSALRATNSVGVEIPEKDPVFKPHGNFKDILTIVEAREFFPAYIEGHTGLGKSYMVEQACAKAGRKYIRVQLTPESDEDSLLGGFRLINGETVFVDGPVVTAMKEGALLLLDELDRATNKIMCLQSVMEGKPVLVQRTGELVKPHPEFNVIATANTKGRGSTDGRYNAATFLDTAFLERFPITITQEYPTNAVVKTILYNHAKSYGVNDDHFIEKLVFFGEVIYKTFEDEGVNEFISVRRLCHILKVYSKFDDKMKAIELCINRFDEETKEAFLDVYTKLDETMEQQDQ